MPNGEVKKDSKGKEVLLLGTKENHRILVYTTDPETGVTLLRAISKTGRVRFNGWWRLKMKFKDDRKLPVWWDHPSESVAIPDRVKWEGEPKVKSDKGIKGKLEKSHFILIDITMVEFLDRKYDVEEE